MLQRNASTLLLLLSLTGCATSGQSQTSAPFCSVAKPIYLSHNDSLSYETARAIVAHNEKGSDLCGWKPPSK